jgi:hypothetical protein
VDVTTDQHLIRKLYRKTILFLAERRKPPGASIPELLAPFRYKGNREVGCNSSLKTRKRVVAVLQWKLHQGTVLTV